MKVIVLLGLLCTCCKAQDLFKQSQNPAEVPITTPHDISTNLRQQCLEEVQLDHDIFEELNNGMISIENSTEYANYFSCYWKKKNLQYPNGTINFAELEKLVKYSVEIAVHASDVPLLNTWPIATKIVEECKYIQAKTLGEKAVKMRNCLFGKLLHERNEQTNGEDFEDIPNLEVTEEDCVNELTLDGLQIEEINRHYMVPENVTQFGDFLACSWKKDNLLDVNDNFNISALCMKLDEVVENEILARSRIVYLRDIITQSVIEGGRKIEGDSDGELVLKLQNYIMRRIPYFKMVV